jgi:hypothetical protein
MWALDPQEPHLSTCQNAFWDGWDRNGPVNWRYCEAPVMSLGIPSERDICQECAARTRVWGEGLAARWAASIAAGSDPHGWIEGTAALLADEHAWYEREAAARAPLSKLHKIRRGIASRAAALAAVRAAVAAQPAPAQPAPA